jgi:hypothetical protein
MKKIDFKTYNAEQILQLSKTFKQSGFQRKRSRFFI